MGTEQSVQMTNLHKKFFSPWKQLTFMIINKHGGHQNLRTRRP
jgi:hypothetical protein